MYPMIIPAGHFDALPPSFFIMIKVQTSGRDCKSRESTIATADVIYVTVFYVFPAGERD